MTSVMALYAVHGTRPWTSYSFSSCTTLIVSIFQFASSILQFGAKKLGPRRWIWILMSGRPVENRNTFVSQKRVQRYCFFVNWPNNIAKKMHFLWFFFIKCWKCAFYKNRVFEAFWGNIGYLCCKTWKLSFYAHAHFIYIEERAYARAYTRTSRDSRLHRSVTPTFCATLFGRTHEVLPRIIGLWIKKRGDFRRNHLFRAQDETRTHTKSGSKPHFSPWLSIS